MNKFKLLAVIFCCLSLSLLTQPAMAQYSTSQFESDLSLNPAFNYAGDNEQFLYTQSEYIASQNNPVTNLSDFHGWLKALSPAYLPKPTLIPIGVNGLPIFIPTYPLPKRVGDSFVQRFLILDQLRYWLGSTVKWGAAGSLTEDDLIQSLYSAGKDYATKKGLRLGSPLNNEAWLESGMGDMIWPEFRIINDKTVLVPVVYLTPNSINNYAVNNHITSPSNSKAVLNTLTISGSASMNLRAGVLDVMNSVNIASNSTLNVTAENQKLVIGGVLSVHGGQITAEKNLNITANAISVRPTVAITNDRYGQAQVIGSLASVNAPNGTLTLTTDGIDNTGIYIEGSEISGNSVKLEAKNGDIAIVATQLQSYSKHPVRGGHHTRSELDYLGSTISGTEAIELVASGEVNIVASDLLSDGAISILAGQGIYVSNAYGEFREQRNTKIGSTEENMSAFRTTAIKANLKAGKGILLNTDSGDIVLRAADIESQDGTTLNAHNGKVKMLIAVEKDIYQYSRVSEKLFTIETEMESWDRDTDVYTTIVGGHEINASQGVVVEYGGKKGATPQEQIDHIAELAGFAGMEWFADLKDNNCANDSLAGDGWSELSLEEREAYMSQHECVDFSFIELANSYEYDRSTNLSPAAMAVISIAIAVATNGVGANLIGGGLKGAYAAMANAAFTTLTTQVTQISVNTALNGGSPYDAWKELGSKENIRQLATAVATAGALAKLNDALGYGEIAENAAGTAESAQSATQLGLLPDGKLAFDMLDQGIQILAETTVRAGIDVLAQGGSISDFGGDFHNAFEAGLKQSAIQELGEGMAGLIGESNLSEALKYISLAASGCFVGAAQGSQQNGFDSSAEKTACLSGAGGQVIGYYLGTKYKEGKEQEVNQATEDWLEAHGIGSGNDLMAMDPEARKLFLDSRPLPSVKEISLLKAKGVDLSRLAGGLAAFIARGDVNIAANGAGYASQYGALFDFENAVQAQAVLDTYLKFGDVFEILNPFKNSVTQDEMIAAFAELSDKEGFEFLRGLSIDDALNALQGYVSVAGNTYAFEIIHLIADVRRSIRQGRVTLSGGIDYELQERIIAIKRGVKAETSHLNLNADDEKALEVFVEAWVKQFELAGEDRFLPDELIASYQDVKHLVPSDFHRPLERMLGIQRGVSVGLLETARASTDGVVAFADFNKNAYDFIMYTISGMDKYKVGADQLVQDFDNITAAMSQIPRLLDNIEDVPASVKESLDDIYDRRDAALSRGDYIAVGDIEGELFIAAAGIINIASGLKTLADEGVSGFSRSINSGPDGNVSTSSPNQLTPVVVSNMPTELSHQATSGVKLVANPDKTTTVLGSYVSDTSKIIDELNYPKNLDFDAKQGGFNVLNTPDEFYKNPTQFWNEYNKPFLDKAIERGDDIILATKPTKNVLVNPKTGELTGYGKEFKYLQDQGYRYDENLSKMVKDD